MWAMIPMFRVRSSATAVFVAPMVVSSPPVVGEGLVGLRHPVHVVLALERAALLVERVEDLARELLGHPLLAALAREGDQPADGERAATALRHLDRNLVVGAADAAAADFEDRGDGLHGLLEHVHGRLARLL